MSHEAQIDLILSTLNAMDVGTLDSIADKLREVQEALRAIGADDLAARANETAAALARGDVSGFKRGRATLQAKVGHLR
jgi:hypothetical protein